MTKSSISSFLFIGLFFFFSVHVLYAETKTIADLDIQISKQNLSCNGASGAPDGMIDLLITGGQPPYTYVWTTFNLNSGLVENAEDQSELIAGNYVVTVYDSAGASKTEEITLSEPTAVAVLAVASDLTCNSGSGIPEGTISLTPSGGAPGIAPNDYTFSWTTSDGSGLIAGEEDQSGLSAGTYHVTITDANNCVLESSYTLTEPTGLAIVGTYSHLSCHSASGFADGAIDITGFGGTMGISPNEYTFAWSTSDGQGLDPTSEDQTGLTAGTYAVVVTDDNGCTVTDWWTLTQPSRLEVTAIVEDMECTTTTLGSLYAVASGGTEPYSYAWATLDGVISSGEQNSKQLTELGVGTYTILVTDNNGCTTTDSWSIKNELGFTVDGLIDDVCNCVDLEILGGIAPFSIDWSTTDGGNIIGGSLKQETLDAGTYTLVITDANGCIHEEVIVFDDAPFTDDNLIQITVNKKNPTCAALPNGEIKIATCGGVAPYTYVWSSSNGNDYNQGVEDQMGLRNGTYVLSVTDQNGLSNSSTIVLDYNQSLSLSGTAFNTCFGEEGGSIELNVSGGQAPFTYYWEVMNGDSAALNGQHLNQDLLNLTVGDYTVEVTDAAGCIVSGNFEIIEKSEIVIEGEVVEPKCAWASGESTGEIKLNINGVVPDLFNPIYTFSWTAYSGGVIPVGHEDDPYLTGITGGGYRVFIYDENGCSAEMNWYLEGADPIAVIGIPNNLNCNSASGLPDGTIDIEASGGVAPYTFIWISSAGGDLGANSTNSEDLIGLSAGTYKVVVTDNNNCAVTDSWTLIEPTAVAVLTTAGDVSCQGNDGYINIIASGGTAPYSYEWQTADGSGLVGNGSMQDALSMGRYDVTITDANGCTLFADYLIEGKEALGMEGMLLNNSCSTNSDIIEITVSGGNPPYSIDWTSTSGTLDQGSGFLLDESDAYIFTGSNVAGLYTFRIKDQDNCEVAKEFFLEDVAGAPIAHAVVENPACYNQSVGEITITIQDGLAPFTYEWTGPDNLVSTDQNLNGLSTGAYRLTVTDANGCTDQGLWTIVVPDEIIVNGEVKNPGIKSNNGAIYLSVAGGNGAYTYLWNNGYTTPNLVGLGKGVYWVEITDGNGCTTVEPFVLPTYNKLDHDIVQIDNLTDTDVSSKSPMTVTGVPFPTSCKGSFDGRVRIEVTGGEGKLHYFWRNSLGDTIQSGYDMYYQDLGCCEDEGIYTVVVTDEVGNTATGTWEVESPDPLELIGSIVQDTCGFGSGVIEISLRGGTPPYFINNVPQSGDHLDQISMVAMDSMEQQYFTGARQAQRYTIDVTDNHNCYVGQEFFMDTHLPLKAVGQVQQPLCHPLSGSPNGEIVIQVYNGQPPYQIEWDGFNSSSNAIYGLQDGNYTATITDALNCEIVENYHLDGPEPIIVFEEEITDPVNKAKGAISVEMGGGTAPFTYLWSNGATTQAIDGLSKGKYFVEVEDANGCQFFKEWTLPRSSQELNEVQLATNQQEIRSGQEKFDAVLTVFPNPAKNELFIELEQSGSEEYEVTLYNVTGKKIKTIGNYAEAHVVIESDVTQLQSGVYFLEAVSAGKRMVKKIHILN